MKYKMSRLNWQGNAGWSEYWKILPGEQLKRRILFLPKYRSAHLRDVIWKKLKGIQ